MASRARATRSASRKARATEAVATGPLGAVSHDELGVIFKSLSDPLEPVVAVALSSTCLGLRTPLQPALHKLKQQHERAKALCRKTRTTCAKLRVESLVDWSEKSLNANDAKTLGMLLVLSPSLEMDQLMLDRNPAIGDVGMKFLCMGLAHRCRPLRLLSVTNLYIGPAGAKTLAAVMNKRAMTTLHSLFLGHNDIGDEGMAVLAAPLRKLQALQSLMLGECRIGDEGVKSLFGNLSRGDFPALRWFNLFRNGITNGGCDTLVTAIKNRDHLPNLSEGYGEHHDPTDPIWSSLMRFNPASEEAKQEVVKAVVARCH